MIFGLSHLTYCTKNITKDLKYFEQFNYKEFFRENNVYICFIRIKIN